MASQTKLSSLVDSVPLSSFFKESMTGKIAIAFILFSWILATSSSRAFRPNLLTSGRESMLSIPSSPSFTNIG